MLQLAHENVCVIGAGKSGMGSVSLLQKIGAHITIYDGNKALKEEEIRKQLPEGCHAHIVLGDFPDSLLDEAALFIVSPGVPMDSPVVQKIEASDAWLMGEIELAYRYEKGSVLAVTGTNGKTTTTSLTGHLLRGYYNDVFVVGNIGAPYTEAVLNTNMDSYTVAELSSFQLESIETFHPMASAILNITPDHLNRHHTMENYIDAKKRITMNQDIMDYCVLNYEDEVLRRFGRELEKEGKCQVVFFSSRRALEHGLYVEKGAIWHDDGLIKTKLCDTAALPIPGKHNYENAMAAAGLAISAGVPLDVIGRELLTFTPVPHRMEYVGVFGGVTYYNDSKGTNPEAAIKAIEAMTVPTYLLAGGYDKGSDYTEWIRAFDGRVKKLILMGATAEAIRECALGLGFPEEDIVMVQTFEEAMDFCKKDAVPGDGVLLSPACASWGMFDNYEQRGDLFKELARAER